MTVIAVCRTLLQAPRPLTRDEALQLRAQGLDLLLAGIWNSAGGPDFWPAEERAELVARQHRAIAHESLETQLLSDVLAAFAHADVAGLLLKGVALARMHYPVSWGRLRSDVDLLIRPEVFPRAERSLREVGWRVLTEPNNVIVSGQRHFVHATSPAPPLDLHLRLFAPTLTHAPAFAELWQDRRSVGGFAHEAWTLGDHHALWYSCVHRALHHAGDDRPLWLFDIDRLARALDPDRWSAVAALAARTRTRKVCADGLDRAAARFDTPFPRDLLRNWRVVSDEPSATFLTARSDLAVEWRSLRMVRTWRGRASRLRAHFFPDAKYMRERYQTRGRVSLSLAYLQRTVSGAAKWLARAVVK